MAPQKWLSSQMSGGLKRNVSLWLVQGKWISQSQFWKHVEDHWDELKWSSNKARSDPRLTCDSTDDDES
jgi:hypothetical protein